MTFHSSFNSTAPSVILRLFYSHGNGNDMKNCIFTRVLLLLFGAFASTIVHAAPIPVFNDPNLQECVDEHVARNAWQAAEDIQHLSCEDRGIFDLGGIEQLVNITTLNLAGNQITNIGNLYAATQLISLNLSGNSHIHFNELYYVIPNNAALKELGVGGITIGNLYSLPLYNANTGLPLDLTWLDISNTGISFLDGLEQFPNLRFLDISNNELSYVDSMQYLNQLEDLNLGKTQIDNANFLAGQTQLKRLSVAKNRNLDFTTLIPILQANPNLQVLDLSGVKISDPSSLLLSDSNTGHPYPLTALYLADTGISDISFLSFYPQLQVLDIANNSVSDISALSSLASLNQLNIGNNRISDISPLLNLTSLTALHLSGNISIDVNDLFTIIEANQELVRLGIGGVPLSDLDQLPPMFNYVTGQSYPLVELDVSNTGIRDLFRLEMFPTLQHLDISDNYISDIAIISQLSNLKSLDASNNHIVDITPIYSLAKLTSLNLSGNSGIDVYQLYPVFYNNPELTELGLGDIAIGELYFLPLYNSSTNFPYNLTRLDISNTGITNLHLLNEFPDLHYLDISNNKLENMDSLQHLIKIEELDLGHLNLHNVDFLHNHTKLTHLNLGGNNKIEFIQLLPTLQNNPNLRAINLNGIKIPDPNLLTLSNPSTGRPHSLTELHLADTGISDINFLSFYPDLRVLELADNNISRIHSLSTLNSLTYLDISNNQVSDIWPLHSIYSLTTLRISGNSTINLNELFTVIDINQHLIRLGLGDIPIGDLYQLPSMFNFTTRKHYPLIELDIGNTGIRDLSRLQEFPTLQHLDISDNHISDITAISQLPNIKVLDASDNRITDIVSLTVLTQLNSLDLSGNSDINTNQLYNIISNNPGLMELGLRDIYIQDFNLLPLYNYDNGQPYNLTRLDISNTGITFLYLYDFPNLRYLDIGGNDLEFVLGLDNLTRLEELSLVNIEIDDLYSISSFTKLRRLNLAGSKKIEFAELLPILQNNPNLRSLDLTGIKIPDPYLLALTTPDNTPYSFDELRLSDTGLVDTNFLSLYPNLKTLDISQNSVSDITVLNGLHSLVELDISQNDIYDLTPLLNLTQLKTFRVSGNRYINVNDLFSIIDTNQGLIRLGLGDIPIRDLHLLPPMINFDTWEPYHLIELDISNAGVSDLYRLQEFPTLQSLNISDNQVSDITVVSGLMNLKALDVSNNRIVDAGPLQPLTLLTSLNLSGNSGIDVNQLHNIISSNTGLTELGLSDIVLDSIHLLPLYNHATGQPFSLSRLDISNTGISDLSGLELFHGLRFLDISDNDLVYLHGLEYLSNLEALNLSNLKPNDLVPLNGHTKFTHLNLAGNENLDFETVLPILRNNPNLVSLNLTGISISDSYLLELFGPDQIPYSIKELHLSDTGLNDIDFLSLYPELKTLDVSRNSIENISILYNLHNLIELDISDNDIYDLTPLLHLTSLETFRVSDNSTVSIADLFSIINTNQGLIRLGLGDIPIEDLYHISHLLNVDTGQPYRLIELDISNTGIDHLAGLQEFTDLQYLNINDNNIHDISPVSSLLDLKSLSVSGNQIIDFTPLNALTRLISLNLSGNTNIDIGQLYTVILNNPQLTEISLADIYLGDIFSLPLHSANDGQPLNLTRLDISNTGISHLHGLDLFPNLHYLDISSNDVGYLYELEYLTRLEELNLADLQIVNIDFLYNHTKLTKLNLAGNIKIDFLSLSSFIHNNSGLRSLDLTGIPISDLYSLVLPPSMEELYLSDTKLDNINALSVYQDLKVLDLSNNYINDLAVLNGLHNLIELDISHNDIQDLAPISHLSTLKTLRVSGNNITNLNVLFSIIDTNHGLTRLGLGGIRIDDLYSLPPMFDFNTGQPYPFIELDVSDTGISNLARLQDFSKLQILNISDNNISDISVISELRNLRSLNASNNQITNIASLNMLNSLNSLKLSGNSGINVNQLFTVLNSNPTLTELGLGDIMIGDLNLLPLYDYRTGRPFSLIQLDVSNTGIDNIDRIVEFPNLKHLDASQNSIVSIGNLYNVAFREIDLSSNQISNIDFLIGQTSLTHLRLANNSNIVSHDLDPILRENTNLRVLDLSGIDIQDPNLLIISDYQTGQSIRLDELYLANTGITDFVFLSFYPELRALDISDNSLADLTLPPIPGLQQLNISDNDLVDLDFLSNLPGLLQVDLSNNQIHDIMSLISTPQLTYINLLGNNGIPCPDLDLLQSQFPSGTVTLPTTCFNGMPPEITIQSPMEGTAASNIDSVVLEAFASDAEDGDISANINWHSNIDGHLATGNGESVTLSIGSHVLTATVTDSNGNNTSASVNIAVQQPQYCDVSGASATEDWIEQISIGEFTTTTGSNNGYGNFIPEQPIPVVRGDSIITVVPGGNGFSNRESWRIWIDFNKDGEFDTTEIVFQGRSTKSFSKTITLPPNTAPGLTVLRVAMKNGFFPSPCEQFPLGEVEDYRIEIQ